MSNEVESMISTWNQYNESFPFENQVVDQIQTNPFASPRRKTYVAKWGGNGIQLFPLPQTLPKVERKKERDLYRRGNKYLKQEKGKNRFLRGGEEML